MNRFIGLIALMLVVMGVSAASASASGTSLALTTVLVAGGVLVHKFVLSIEEDTEAAPVARLGQFVGHVVRSTLRLAMGALAITWIVLGLQWFFGV